MSALTKMLRTSVLKNNPPLLFISENGQILRLPQNVAERLARYAVKDVGLPPNDVFSEINRKYTKAGALLKALRIRENISQSVLADKLSVTQGDISKMEYGKRPIGKLIAKRIAKEFNVHWKMFVELNPD